MSAINHTECVRTFEVLHSEDERDKVAKHVASRGDFIIQGVQGEFYL